MSQIKNHAQEHAYSPASNIPTTPFPYPGNKTRLAKWVLKNTKDHDRWVSPFGGAGGVLFQKTPSENEVVNDINSDITTFYRVLRDSREELKEYLSLTPYAEEQYNNWKLKWDQNWRPKDEIKHAAVFYFLQRASFGSDQTGFRAIASGRKNSSSQFFNSLDRLDDFSKRLDGVIIHNRDYAEIIEKYANDPSTFIYLDPPYHNGERYDWDFNPLRLGNWMAYLEGDYEADWMISSARVPGSVVCYPTIETDLTHQINNREGTKQVTEKLTMNYHPDEVEIFSGTNSTLDKFI